MNLLQEIKMLFAVKMPAENLIAEVNQVKAGWKTTEFWMTIVTQLLAVVAALNGVLDAKTAAIIIAVLNGVYGVLRTLAKVPVVPAPAVSAPTAK